MKTILYIIIGCLFMFSCHDEVGLKQEGSLKTIILFEDKLDMRKLVRIKAMGSDKFIAFDTTNRQFSFEHSSFLYPENSEKPFVMLNMGLDPNNGEVTYFFETYKTDSITLTYKREFKDDGNLLFYRNLAIKKHSFKSAIIEVYEISELEKHNTLYEGDGYTPDIYQNLANTFLKIER